LLNRKLPEGRGWGYFFLYAGVAASADLDLFLDLWTGETGRFHHGISHSLGAAALVGFLAAGTARIMGWRPARAFGIGFLLYASHVLLDTMTVDTKPPLGLQALWPLTDAFTLSPVPLFLDVWRWPFVGFILTGSILKGR
ncbi:MAG: metal-dependent hydrolase, partial [Nitrospirae bacterium]|nr:metal-dependent hydrolase [Nitrospirota bacterium]